MQGVTLTYEAAVTGVGNYLCARVEGKINHYQMKMLENNQIPGLLAARGSMFNGVYRIHYEIDDTRRLGAVLGNNSLHGEAAKQFMGGLLHALSELGEYFLSYMQCLLDVDYIYIDKRGRAKLVYLPIDGQPATNEEGLRLFCQKLFAEHFTADGDPFFLKLLRYVSMQDFSFSGLLKWFEEEEEETGQSSFGSSQGIQTGRSDFSSNQGIQTGRANSNSGQEIQTGQANFNSRQEVQSSQTGSGSNHEVQNDAVQEKKKFSFPGKGNAENTGFAIPGGAFAMPQANAEGKKKEEKKKEEKKSEKEKKQKEKGASLFKSLLGGKKEKEGKGVFGGQEINSAPSKKVENSTYSDTSQKAGGWQGTVMLGGQETGGSTVMLGASAAPYLLYEGQKISLEHFPFSLGKENTDYCFNKNVVSRIHASIGSRDGAYYIMDENSKNHTWLNGKQLSPYTETKLQDGDTLKLASEILTFHL